ncbi:2-amino-4-hydroxy-6-hydroxymethyldihydropteridine diphosphokinase [Thalassotalea sp. PLHSN55]|uniref:2-amino-4-hydroxy-6- hydroxymethyldihydropteridine diphosphokinase n=1 Tax=Thalassotalea sp. PLHSN55 TaxID=3435888 RepID=UPI003F84A69E
MNLVYIGIGSNLSNPKTQVTKAVAEVDALASIAVTQVSSLYVSKPMGPQDQPDYVNAVIAVTTPLSAHAVLDQLQNIENQAGRVRKENRWGARILDLDILLYNQEIIDDERLTVPHYGMKLREFVLLPLAEIAPNLTLPDGDSVLELSEKIARNSLENQGKIAWQ